MAQFDVHALPDGALVVDCQADILRDLDTRFVVPLLPAGIVVQTGSLNPSFELAGQQMNLYPQGAASVPRSELRSLVGSLAGERCRIMNALDLLLSGF